MIQKIAKRNGDLEDFDRSRIESAVLLAADAVGEVDKSFIPTFTDNVIRDMEHVFTELLVHRVPSVEDVQDIVERNLVRSNRFEMAKAYILYREKRREEREEKHEKLAQQFEKHSLMVTKAHGDKERFDAGKLRKILTSARSVLNRSAGLRI
jgi:anaerobic ribonucleoside-triphosphate reductase